ncbi:hypothetical protein [Bradyrhizobium sp.]|uniref:hypothetical protein n=1 Tax=Bradyrhizobium sp. TaxID=376 RepID=UPI003BB11038
MIRKKWRRFSIATNATRLRGDHAAAVEPICLVDCEKIHIRRLCQRVFSGSSKHRARFAPVNPKVILLEIIAMEIAQQSRFATAKPEARGHDTTILLGYSILAIVFLIATYFASISPAAPGDFAMMSVFP